jgi:metal-dependent amidase/aminoacylase/carboxypeptidase family protein
MAGMESDRIGKLVDDQREFMLATRREIHRHPELSFKEERTASLIRKVLEDAGYSPRHGVGSGRTGLWATLEGGLPGPTIALRADTDALPVEERNDLPFRSRNAGVMHACGHDAHTAILLGAARAMAAVKELIHGRVVFLFQHAEEYPPGGAIEMIEAGCLKASTPSSACTRLPATMPAGSSSPRGPAPPRPTPSASRSAGAAATVPRPT